MDLSILSTCPSKYLAEAVPSFVNTPDVLKKDLILLRTPIVFSPSRPVRVVSYSRQSSNEGILFIG